MWFWCANTVLKDFAVFSLSKLTQIHSYNLNCWLSHFIIVLRNLHYVKSVQVRNFSGPCFPVFGLNMEIYCVNHRIHSKYGKIRTRKTPYLDTFDTVLVAYLINKIFTSLCFFPQDFSRICFSQPWSSIWFPSPNPYFVSIKLSS